MMVPPFSVSIMYLQKNGQESYLLIIKPGPPSPVPGLQQEIRLRIVRAWDGDFYIQVNQNGPRLLMR